ncbi:MAG: HD domain-containing protein [Clostridium sp.]|uniref:HD domain-containing protein n=1 Tax=Clostridium sp. TaxID=1506 RepID=UPI001EB2A66F|nr:HD domain-containing protein [Clostridium sp.]MBS5885040.1 HD domain-containing protein [Clostridium sp.]MDU7148536.1 HD domain-containing protein [Clostridium sp.]MDU7241825.1 HD domain-containing protein [Clostridium sp.]
MRNLNEIKEKISKESNDVLDNKIDKSLLKYLTESILENYKTFDKGHGIKHIATVIDSSIKLSKYFPVNKNMVLTIAIYHDLGMSIDRKTHQIHSRDMLINDINLKNWFTKEELTLMGEACEDHRASNAHEPRSVYGYIISDADRTTDIYDMIERCYNFSRKNYSDLNEEETYIRVYSHLVEKYGEGGYAKFYLEESKEVIMKPYIEAQEILKKEEDFRCYYNKIILN